MYEVLGTQEKHVTAFELALSNNPHSHYLWTKGPQCTTCLFRIRSVGDCPSQSLSAGASSAGRVVLRKGFLEEG